MVLANPTYAMLIYTRFWPTLHMRCLYIHGSGQPYSCVHHRVGQDHIYTVYTVFLAGKSPYTRSYAMLIYTQFWPTLLLCPPPSSRSCSAGLVSTSVVHLTLDGVIYVKLTVKIVNYAVNRQSVSDGNAVIYGRYLLCHLLMTLYVHDTSFNPTAAVLIPSLRRPLRSIISFPLTPFAGIAALHIPSLRRPLRSIISFPLTPFAGTCCCAHSLSVPSLALNLKISTYTLCRNMLLCSVPLCAVLCNRS